MPLVERLELLIKTVGAAAAAADLRQLGDASTKLGGTAAATGGKFDKLASGLGVSSAALKSGLVGGAVAAGGALVAFGVKSVQAYADATKAANNFQRASGATAEESSLLVAAMDDVGISAETGAKAMFNLAKRVETSGAKLAEFGLAATRGKDGTVDLAATLLDVSDTYTRMRDPAEKAAFLTAAFGKAGQDLIPILEKGKAGIEGMFQGARDTGQVFSEGDLKRSREYTETMDDLSDALGEVSLVAGQLLTPVIEGFAETITDTVGFVKSLTGAVGGLVSKMNDLSGADKENDKPGFFDTVGEFYNEVIRGRDPADEAAASTERMTNMFGNLGPMLGPIAEGLAGLSTSATETSAEFDKLSSVTLAATAAQRSFEQAGRSLEAAQRSEADAQKDLNTLLKTGRFDLEAIRDAEVSLASAKRSTANAARDQAKAQKAYDVALANANDLRGLDSAQDALAEAADNLADANDGVADATEREADAARALRLAQAGDPEWQDKIADARQRVKDATQGVADAEYNLGQRSYENVQAHDAEKDAISGKADQLARVRDEIEKIIALHPETLPFLGPTLAGLPAALPTSGHPFFGGPTGTQASTTNNVTVNVAAPVADPVLISKEITWALIP